MRREEYERSYGRRSHVPPPLPSQQEDPRSRRSRTKMKCLISIGLILPALAAVIGVAAWAVSADVVMNSANNRPNKVDNSLLQSFSMGNENQPDIFRNNEENQRLHSQTEAATSTTKQTTTTTSTSTTSTPSTTTTTTTTTVAPQTLSPKDASDVNAILSKLISASGAVSGSNGPRFVVVAPLPDHPDQLSSQQTISRADSPTAESTNKKEKDSTWQPSKEEQPEDLAASGSSQSYSISKPNPQAASQHSLQRNGNSTSRGVASKSEATRRIGEKPLLMHMANSNRRTNSGYNSQPLELTGFEPFDSMMQSESVMASSSHIPKVSQNPPPSFSSSYKRGPPQGFFGSRNPHKPMQHFEMKDQHLFNAPHVHEHGVHNFNVNPRPPMMAPHQHGVGFKPIQHQLHHMDNGNGPQPEESRWGAMGFVPPPSGYVHKPPEGISLSISSPANSGTHVSSEPVSVIKSFFLPFLPKPRLNMNARVVFGVVLDKGMGIGGKKEAGHHSYH